MPLTPEQLSCFLSEGVTDYAFVTFDPENRITSWSRGAERILGYSEAEVLGRDGHIIFTEEDIAAGVPEKEMSSAVRDGRADDERWHRRKDGSRFWGSGVMAAVRDNTGGLAGFVKVMRDLTARVQAEAALRASEERFRLLVENVLEYALFQTDLEGRISSWHTGGERLFGYTAAEIVGKCFACLFTPEDRASDLLQQQLASIARGERSEHARWAVRKDGSRFWARCVTEPVRDENGQLRGAAKVLRDDTERNRAEEAQRQFEAVANLVPDMLWSNDARGSGTWHNERWLEYTGMTKEEALGAGWTAAIHPDDLPELQRQFTESLRLGKPHRHEHRIRRHDGAYRWFLARAEPVRGPGGEIVRWFGAVTDIDEHRNELRALAGRLMTMQEDERRRVARELHDSLGQQLGVAQAELAQVRQLEPSRASTLLEDLEQRIGRISDEVRALSHRLHPSILDDLGLPAALRSLAEEFERAHGRSVEVAADERMGQAPAAVKTAVYRIAQEALRNAGKHAGRDARISISLSAAQGRLHLVVADTGPGFDVSGTRGKGGLGIVSMEERARLAGGTLAIESAPGRGASVRLAVPVCEHAARAAKPRVLIADDHGASRYILRRFAEPECEIVAEVDNGLEAVRVAEQLRPALVILDVSMPIMGGIDAARLMRERLPEVRIIFASQHTTREYVEEAFRVGAQGYIIKQAAATELAAAIREVLAGRPYRSPLTSGKKPR